MGMRRMFRRDNDVKIFSDVRMCSGLDNKYVANMTKVTCTRHKRRKRKKNEDERKILIKDY